MIYIKYMAVFTKIPHWPLTRARRIHSLRPEFLMVYFNIILQLHSCYTVLCYVYLILLDFATLIMVSEKKQTQTPVYTAFRFTATIDTQ